MSVEILNRRVRQGLLGHHIKDGLRHGGGLWGARGVTLMMMVLEERALFSGTKNARETTGESQYLQQMHSQKTQRPWCVLLAAVAEVVAVS